MKKSRVLSMVLAAALLTVPLAGCGNTPGGSGDEIVIGFNCRYLIDTMRAIESEKVRVKLITPFTSVTFEPVEDEEKEDRYLYMVLPLRMKE